MAANTSSLVDKATSDLLIGPDWAMNLEICDAINYDPGQAREVVKAVKKRLSNKSPRVQLLALTVLETAMKNCGEVVHQNVAEKEILNDMVKIVKKKSDMAVRDKILVLLDSWQEAFGGFSSKYPQYYGAFDDLRRAGVEFPERSAETAVPMFTLPPMHPPPSYQHPNYPPPSFQHSNHAPSSFQHPSSLHASHGSSPYGQARLDAVMAATDGQVWRSKDMDAAQSGVEVLNEMLNAIDPQDKQAVKDDVIVQLVDQCRSYQKNILQLVNTSSDEGLLCQGLALNDELQRTLAKHDAIVSGSPLPRQSQSGSPKSFTAYEHEHEDVEDEFAQLAHRPSLRPGHASGSQDTPAAATQFTLPPPPQPIRRINARLDGQGRAMDFLSGESFKDVSPTTPGTLASPLSQHTSSPVLGQPSALNPFADSPSFVATPPQAQASVTSPHQQYQPSHFVHQSSPGGGYVVPWASGNSESHALQLQDQTKLYSPQVEGQHLQGGQTSSPWISYGTNTVSSLPPPPALYTERHQYFQEQTNLTSQQLPSASTSLEQQTMNLSLQDTNRNAPIGKSSPAKGAGGSVKDTSSTDRLFEDLVDFGSVSANFKKAGILSSMTRPNTSKASGM